MKYEYQIMNKFDENVIESKIIDPFGNEMMRKVIMLQDKSICDCLIKLGWTPPIETAQKQEGK